MQAEEIMRFALFKEVPKRQRRKKRKHQNGMAARKGDEDAEGGSDEESDEESGNETEEQRMSTPPAAKDQTRDPIWGEDSQDVQMEVVPQPGPSVAATSVAPAVDGKIRPDRFVDPMLGKIEAVAHHISKFPGCSSSVQDWRICLPRGFKTQKKYSLLSCWNLSMMVYPLINYMELQKRLRLVTLCRRTMS
jgi:hypothetical protein